MLPVFARRPLASLRPIDVQLWMRDMAAAGLAASTRRSAHTVLGMILGSAVENSLIARHVARGVKRPADADLDDADAPPDYLTAEQVRALADAFDLRLAAMVYVMGYGMLRFSEAAALRVGRVNAATNTLEVVENLSRAGRQFRQTKGKERRTVVLPPDVMTIVREHVATWCPQLDRGALLFTTSDGTPLVYENFRRREWRRALVAAGLDADLGTHALRRSGVTLMLAAGVPPHVVQRQAGHKDLGLTMSVYARLFPEDLPKVGEVMNDVFRASRERPAGFSRTSASVTSLLDPSATP